VTHASILQRLQQPGSARHLALVRVAYGLHLLRLFSSPVYGVMDTIGTHPHPMAGTWLPEALEALIARHASALALVGALASLALLFGAATRIASVVCFVCFLATQHYWFRSTVFHDEWVFMTFPLLVMCFAPMGDFGSVDAWRKRATPPANARAPVDRRIYRWPAEAFTFWYAFVYVAAGLAKLLPLSKGAVWLSGVSTQEFAIEFALDSPLHWWLGHTPFDYGLVWPFTIASVLTVVVELLPALILFTERFRALVVVVLLGMHATILLMGIPGFPFISLVCATGVLLPEWFERETQPSPELQAQAQPDPTPPTA